MFTGQNILEIFARNVEHLAFKRGLKRSDLAARIGVTPHVLNRILECRNRTMDPEVVAQLLDFFDCSPNDLFLQQSDVVYFLSGLSR